MLQAKAVAANDSAQFYLKLYSRTRNYEDFYRSTQYEEEYENLLKAISYIPDYAKTAEDSLSEIREALKDPYKRASLQNALDMLSRIETIIWLYDQKELRAGADSAKL
jgi:hypothetical protein